MPIDEEEFETVKQILATVARVAERNTTGIDRLTEKLDRLTEKVDRLTERFDQLALSQQLLQTSLSQLVLSQQNTQTSLDNLARVVVRVSETEAEDRAEIRRIWEYLLGQQRNGNGNG
jgi:predicted nuclease with TOPRIM domain